MIVDSLLLLLWVRGTSFFCIEGLKTQNNVKLLLLCYFIENVSLMRGCLCLQERVVQDLLCGYSLCGVLN